MLGGVAGSQPIAGLRETSYSLACQSGSQYHSFTSRCPETGLDFPSVGMGYGPVYAIMKGIYLYGKH